MLAGKGIFGRLTEKLNPAQAQISGEQPYASPKNIYEYQRAYGEIDIINRSISMIVNAAADIPFVVEGTPGKLANKVLNRRPNPFEDRNRFFRRAYLDFMLDGNVFFYVDDLKDLYILPANNVEIVSHPKTFVSHYVYTVHTNAAQASFFSVPKKDKVELVFAPENIIHVMQENDESIYRGESLIKPVSNLIELYYFMVDFQRNFFKNNAIPGLTLRTENNLSKNVKQRLLEEWTAAYNSINKGSKKPLILDGGLKVDPFSEVNFDKLDFEESIERIQHDIAKALGVPYVLLKSGNNANIEANQKLFYLHTVLPMLNKFCSAFMLHYGDGINIQPNRKSIPALQPELSKQAHYYATLVNTGIITPNEARVDLGREEIEGHGEIRVPVNVTGSATNPSVGGRPDSDEDVNNDD